MATVYIKQAWLVLVLAIVFAAALACIQAGLGPRIEENKRNETYQQVPYLVGVRDEAAAQAVRVQEFATPDGKIAYQAATADGEPLGWVIKGAGQGFADKIELLVGLDPQAKRITGLFVLDQKETPALGNRIVEAEWRAGFDGLSASEPVVITRGESVDNGVEALSGATISSESVASILNAAVSEFRELKDQLAPLEQE